FPPIEIVAETQDPDGDEEMKGAGSDKEMKEVVPKATRKKMICADKPLVKEIKCTALAMKQIQMETWHLVNLHTLRCLEHDLPLPDYGKTFFDHCCAGVASTRFARATSGVMNREQFRKRLRAYVLIKFGKSGDDLSPAEEKVTKKLVGQIMYACYNVEETGCLEALQMRDVLTPDGEEWREK
ncbi:hypothetical protein F443_21770, partial [Phytophthora nicotianae P1569]